MASTSDTRAASSIRMAPIIATASECAVCGTPMRRAWTDDLSDFRWVAEDGSVVGAAEGVPATAPTTVVELLDRLTAAGDMEAYSSWLARYQSNPLCLLPWQHRHHAVEPESLIAPDEVPECCGWPMRAAPGAWICRVDGTIVRCETAS